MRKIIMKDLASIYTDVPTLRPGSVEAYALAFASAGVATVVRLAIDPYVMGAECLPFFPAVIISALIGGRDAGLLCVVLSAAAVTFLQMPPLTLLLFVLLAIFIVILITRMRLAIQREQAAHTLQASKDRLQLALEARVVALRCPPPCLFLGCAVQGDFRHPRGWSHRRRVHELGASRRCGKRFGRPTTERSIPPNRSALRAVPAPAGEQ
jgi:hypothetical protein